MEPTNPSIPTSSPSISSTSRSTGFIHIRRENQKGMQGVEAVTPHCSKILGIVSSKHVFCLLRRNRFSDLNCLLKYVLHPVHRLTLAFSSGTSEGICRTLPLPCHKTGCNKMGRNTQINKSRQKSTKYNFPNNRWWFTSKAAGKSALAEASLEPHFAAS